MLNRFSALAATAIVLWSASSSAEDRPTLLSTSGTELSPATLPAPPVNVDARIAQLEARLAELEKKDDGFKLPSWLRGLSFNGLVQPQLLMNLYNAAASPNATGGVLPDGIGANDVTATSNGDTTNTNFFRVRRSRVQVTYEPNKHARFTIEIEPLAAAGPGLASGTIARNIEVDAVAPIAGGNAKLVFGAGIFKVPFNFETPENDADRPFIERSFMQRNLFPAEFDTGLHADFLWRDKLAITASVLNGHMIGEPGFTVVPDLNRGKDVTLRANYNFGALDVGASGYVGRGQVVDAQKLRFKQFTRWAIGGEAAVHHAFSEALGPTKAYAEIVLAQNMDRGAITPGSLPKIPDDITADVVARRELGAVVRIEQSLGRTFMVGFRWDWYTPDYAIAANGRHTLAGLFVVQMGKGLRTMIEYDHALDNVHSTGPAPAIRVIDTVSCVLQGRL